MPDLTSHFHVHFLQLLNTILTKMPDPMSCLYIPLRSTFIVHIAPYEKLRLVINPT